MADTNSGQDNIFSESNPQVINHDYMDAAPTIAGGETPRTFPRQVLTGNSRGIQQFGTPNLFADSGNNYFGVAKNNITQVLMGNQPNFGEGFYVTKDGIDARTASNSDDFIFNSGQNVFKIIKSYNSLRGATVAGYSIASAAGWAAGSAATVLAHELKFIPACIAFVDYGSPNLVLTPYTQSNERTLAEYVQTQLFVVTTATNISINSITKTNATDITGGTITIPPYNFKIYLLQETAATN